MAYPVLAKNDTWYSQGGTTVKRTSITEIEFLNNYTPDSAVQVLSQWDASADLNGSIMCYIIGTKLFIAGNGSGKICLNASSAALFCAGDMSDSFSQVTKILGLEIVDTSLCTAMHYMFYNCNKLVELDLSNFVTDNVITMSGMFYQCLALSSLNISTFNTCNVNRMNLMFYACAALTDLDISNFDMSKVSDVKSMFDGARNLTNLKLPKRFVPAGDCTGLFKEKNISDIDTSEWDTSACTDMSFMFYGCSSLGEIDVSNWDVSKVTSFDHFAAHANLKRKGIENWKTTSATNMNALFHNCAEEELDLSGWDVSKNQFFCQMFENSPNLKRIKGLDRWDTSAGLGFDGMFERCYKLEEVDLSSFNTTKAKNGTKASTNGHTTATLQNMFLSCNNLKKVKLGPNFSINGNGTNTTAGNKLILPTPSTNYIAGADGNWYAFNGDPYAPNAIPDRTADTYFASFPLCQNEDVIVKNGSLIDVAKAIKEKNGATAKYTPAQFGAAIRAL